MDSKSYQVEDVKPDVRKSWLKTLDHVVGAVLRYTTMGCLVVLFILLLVNVISRYIVLFSFGWFDEFVQMSFAYFIFLGSAALWREREHFKLDFVKVKLLRMRFGIVWVMLIDAFSIAFFSVLFYYGMRLTIIADQTTPILKMPQRVLYVVIPISSLIMFLYAIRDIVQDIRGILNR